MSDIHGFHVYPVLGSHRLVDQYHSVKSSFAASHGRDGKGDGAGVKLQNIPALAGLDRSPNSAKRRRVDRPTPTIRDMPSASQISPHMPACVNVPFPEITNTLMPATIESQHSDTPHLPVPTNEVKCKPESLPDHIPTQKILHAPKPTDTIIVPETPQPSHTHSPLQSNHANTAHIISDPLPKIPRSAQIPDATSKPCPSAQLLASLTTTSSAQPPDASLRIGPQYAMLALLDLNLYGASFSYDLNTLETDPKGIIELLKLTASDRGSWMIVGAHYRRIGNPRAAISVVTSMLEGSLPSYWTLNASHQYCTVMADRKVPENDLKPAFLLLSGCETDVGKSLKTSGKDPEAVSEHYKNSQKYLQKVYGRLSASRSLTHTLIAPNTPSGAPTTRSESSAPNTQSARPVQVDASRLPSRPLSASHHRILEREIQSLRDRHSDQADELSDVRSVKRKLEDVVDYERETRRKLEWQLAETKKERDNARKMESFALEQVKREVESRRRAEEWAERAQQDAKRDGTRRDSQGSPISSRT